MGNLKKISVRQYSISPNADVYKGILSNLLPKNDFLGNKFSLNEVSYADVRYIERLMQKGKTFDDISTMFELGFKVTREQFYDADIVSYFYAQNYLIEAIKGVRFTESKVLSSIDINKDLWEQAGGKVLNAFGDIMPLIKLGRIYGIYPFELEKRPYSEIFNLLVAHKTEDETNKRYHELTNPIKKPKQ